MEKQTDSVRVLQVCHIFSHDIIYTSTWQATVDVECFNCNFLSLVLYTQGWSVVKIIVYISLPFLNYSDMKYVMKPT